MITVLCAFILKSEPALLRNPPVILMLFTITKGIDDIQRSRPMRSEKPWLGCDDTRLWAWFVVILFKWRQSDEVISSLNIKNIIN